MDLIIQRNWAQKNGTWVAFALLAAVCTIALLSVDRNASHVLGINEGRIVVSTVKQGQFDDFIPVRAQVAPLRTIYLDAIEGGSVEVGQSLARGERPGRLDDPAAYQLTALIIESRGVTHAA